MPRRVHDYRAVAPYQIRLDDGGSLVYAPEDSSRVIRAARNDDDDDPDDDDGGGGGDDEAYDDYDDDGEARVTFIEVLRFIQQRDRRNGIGEVYLEFQEAAAASLMYSCDQAKLREWIEEQKEDEQKYSAQVQREASELQRELERSRRAASGSSSQLTEAELEQARAQEREEQRERTAQRDRDRARHQQEVEARKQRQQVADERLHALLETSDAMTLPLSVRDELEKLRADADAKLVLKMEAKLERVSMRATVDEELQEMLDLEDGEVDPAAITKLLEQRRGGAAGGAATLREVASPALVEQLVRKRERRKDQIKKAKKQERKLEEEKRAGEEAGAGAGAEDLAGGRQGEEEGESADLHLAGPSWFEGAGGGGVLAEAAGGAQGMWHGLGQANEEALSRAEAKAEQFRQKREDQRRRRQMQMQSLVEVEEPEEGDEEDDDGATATATMTAALAGEEEVAWWAREGSVWRDLGCELPPDIEELDANRRAFLAHHILVVDNSGSMRTADVRGGAGGVGGGGGAGGRGAAGASASGASSSAAAPMITRSEAVQGVLLQQFLQTQLASGASANERISLVKLEAAGGAKSWENDRDAAPMPFALFPLGVSVSRKLQVVYLPLLLSHLSHRSHRSHRSHLSHLSSPVLSSLPLLSPPLPPPPPPPQLELGEPKGHGPYLPALRQLLGLCKAARPYLAPFAETKVLFLTDGKPGWPKWRLGGAVAGYQQLVR